MQEILSSVPGSERSPGERNENLVLLLFCSSLVAGKSHGERNQEGYSSWDLKRARHDLAIKQINNHSKEASVITRN